jgi:hypothetical protein
MVEMALRLMSRFAGQFEHGASVCEPVVNLKRPFEGAV